MPPLRQLIYASSSVGLLSPSDLADIVQASRRNNAERGISGALLYADGNILQVLEGAPNAVEAVYAHVERDGRHRGVLKLVDRRVARRAFPGWRMGLVQPNSLDEADRAAVCAVWEAGGTEDRVVQHMTRAFLASTPQPRARSLVS